MTSLKIALHSLSSLFTDTDFPATAYLDNLVPNLKDLSRTSFYSYKGSLTTPPCYQSVKWIVLKKAISAGEREVNVFVYCNTILERIVFNQRELVMKPGKHQVSKQRCQYLCPKVHDRVQTFVLRSYTLHELRKQHI